MSHDLTHENNQTIFFLSAPYIIMTNNKYLKKLTLVSKQLFSYIIQ